MRKCGEDLSEYGYRKLEGYKLCSIDELDMFSKQLDNYFYQLED